MSAAGPVGRTVLPLIAPVPGSSFSGLLVRLGSSSPWSDKWTGTGSPRSPKATTVLAIRYPGGVALVGDRQATEGNLVAHRRIQKVFQADEFSAVAIAGSRRDRHRDGPAVPD